MVICLDEIKKLISSGYLPKTRYGTAENTCLEERKKKHAVGNFFPLPSTFSSKK